MAKIWPNYGHKTSLRASFLFLTRENCVVFAGRGNNDSAAYHLDKDTHIGVGREIAPAREKMWKLYLYFRLENRKSGVENRFC
jgi:hypothetical protein